MRVSPFANNESIYLSVNDLITMFSDFENSPCWDVLFQG